MTSNDTSRRPSGAGTGTTTGRRRGLNWWQAPLAGALAASAVNLAIWAVARLAGASMEHLEEDGLHTAAVGDVLFMSAVPMVLGIVLAAALALLWRGFIRVAQVVGGGLGIITGIGPLLLDADSPTRVALALMHVVSGVVVVLALEGLHRWATARAQAAKG